VFEDPSGITHHYEGPGWYIDDVQIIRQVEPIFSGSDDFESGWDGWFSDRGLWQLGTPTSGPDSAYSGSNCMATILGGNYPFRPDSRLISPVVDLGITAGDEEIVLRFWQHFNWAPSSDKGLVQINVYDDVDDIWSGWTTLTTYSLHTPVWHRARVDLTAYAGKRVRIGFLHDDVFEDPIGITNHYEGPGWYIDDVQIVHQARPLFSGSDDFESGWGGWYSNRGLWQLGTPTSGPGSAHSGSNCIATILAGNYPFRPDSRLISPVVDLETLAEDEEIVLRYWQHFAWAPSSDRGLVQISVYNDVDDIWSDWTTLTTYYLHTPVWHRARVDLTAYAGKRVRIGFLHDDVFEDPSGITNHYEGPGWYIDDVEIIRQHIPLLGCEDNFESGWGGWYSDRGIWQLGEPTSGPGSAYSESNLMATILDGNYPFRPDSRLITPVIDLEPFTRDDEILLRFWQHYNWYPSSDNGQIQVSVYDDTSHTWSDWTTLKTLTQHTPVWHRERVDLTAYAGKWIRVGLLHEDVFEDPSGITHHYESAGWYIDDVVLEPCDPTAVILADFSLSRSDDGVDVRWAISASAGEDDFRLVASLDGDEWKVPYHQEGTGSFVARDRSSALLGGASVTYTLFYRDSHGQWGQLAQHTISLAPPAVTRLLPPYPNPFNPRTTIRFTLSKQQPVRLSVHDARGREVMLLLQGEVAAGYRELAWEGRDTLGRRVASGVYVARLQTMEGLHTQRLVLLK
jgi:hypothetical protein